MNWLRDWLLPTQASTLAPTTDGLFMFVTYLSIFFFLLVTIPVVYFIIRYKRRRPDEITPHITHNFVLEVTWTAIPLLIVIGLFFWGFHGYMKAQVAPGESMEIVVTAKKWQWEFEYPNGMRTLNELHVPLNKPVRLIMSAEDVLHSFFVPAFRIKQDVLPGRYTEIWFEGTRPGVYQLFCAEYCGKGHSDMLAKIAVDDEARYERWLEEGDESMKTMPLTELGKLIYETRGCATCHSLTGERGQGPSWKSIFGKTEQFSNAPPTLVDANYIRESVLEPQKKIVSGFEGIMPTYQGLLREREIQGVIEYIKSLK